MYKLIAIIAMATVGMFSHAYALDASSLGETSAAQDSFDAWTVVENHGGEAKITFPAGFHERSVSEGELGWIQYKAVYPNLTLDVFVMTPAYAEKRKVMFETMEKSPALDGQVAKAVVPGDSPFAQGTETTYYIRNVKIGDAIYTLTAKSTAMPMAPAAKQEDINAFMDNLK